MANDKISRKKGNYILPADLIRLHVALGWVETEEEKDELKQYGNVKRGRTVTRDIIVPNNMPLRSLHFALQRAFGFCERHLHRFEIYDDDFKGVTDNKTENLLNLRGVIFTQDSNYGHDPYEPVFTGGSFKEWLKKQYTGPYAYYGETLKLFNDSVADKTNDNRRLSYTTPDDEYYYLSYLRERDKDAGIFERWTGAIPARLIDDLPGSGDFVKIIHGTNVISGLSLEYCSVADPEAIAFTKVRLGDLPVYEGISAMREYPTQIIEGLRIGDVLALSGDYLPYNEDGEKVHTVTGLKHPQIVTKEQIQAAMKAGRDIPVKPFADVLTYVYDYGDNWHFMITGSKGCSDLVEDGVITEETFEKSIQKAHEKLCPVLIAKDGDMLIEDGKNVHGFAEFLSHVRLDPDIPIKEFGDYIDPQKAGTAISWDQYEAEQHKTLNDFKKYLKKQNIDIAWNQLEDKKDVDGYGMTRARRLAWALSQGWHRGDFEDIDLL